MTRGKLSLRHHSLRDNLAHQVKLAAQVFSSKENTHEQWWRRAFGRRRRLGIRQHPRDNFVLERPPLHLLDDCSRHFQLVLRCVLRVDEVNFTRSK